MGMRRTLQLYVGVPEDQRPRDLSATVRDKLTNGRVEWAHGGTTPGAPIIIGGYRLVHMVTDYTAAQVQQFAQQHPETEWRLDGYMADLFPAPDGTIHVWQPPHPRLVDYLADIPIYDAEGNPIGTERPAEFTPPHVWSFIGAYWGILPATGVPDPDSPYWT